MFSFNGRSPATIAISARCSHIKRLSQGNNRPERWVSGCQHRKNHLQLPSMRRPIPVTSFFCSFHDFFHFPFSQAASVATLPSALVVSHPVGDRPSPSKTSLENLRWLD